MVRVCVIILTVSVSNFLKRTLILFLYVDKSTFLKRVCFSHILVEFNLIYLDLTYGEASFSPFIILNRKGAQSLGSEALGSGN